MSESVREVRWPRRAVNVASPAWTAEQKREGVDWDLFVSGKPYGDIDAKGGEALIRNGIWREVGQRVVASTGCEPIAEAPGNVNVGVTVHCGCGVWTDDVRVAVSNSSETPNSSTDWQPFDGTFRAGVEYRTRLDFFAPLTYVDSDGACDGFPHHLRCIHGSMWYSDNGDNLGNDPDWTITHQRPAAAPEPVATAAPSREWIQRMADGEDACGSVSARSPDEAPPACAACNVPWPDHLGVQGTCQQFRDALQEISQLQEHERQTHERLGAILGTDDSLEECAKRLQQRCERAEREVERYRNQYAEASRQWSMAAKSLDDMADDRRRLQDERDALQKRLDAVTVDPEISTAHLRQMIVNVLEDATRTLCQEVRCDARKRRDAIAAAVGGAKGGV